MKSRQYKKWLDGRRPINVIKRPDGTTVIVFVGGTTVTPTADEIKRWKGGEK